MGQQGSPPEGVWQRLVDAQPEPVILADTGGVIIYVNRAASVLCGAPGDTLCGRPLGDVVELEEPGAPETAAWVRRDNGDRTPVQVSSTPCGDGVRALRLQPSGDGTALLDALPDAVFICSTARTITYANAAACDLLQRPHEKIVGKRLADFQPAAAGRATDAASPEPLDDAHVLHPNGHIVPVESRSVTLPDGTHLVTVRAVSTWVDRHEAVRFQEEQWRRLLESANDLIFTHDLHGRLQTVNRAWERLMGMPRREALTIRIQDLLTVPDRRRARSALRSLLSGQSVQLYHVDLRRPDGRTITLEVSCWLSYEDGRPVGIQGIARDITDRIRAEDALRTSEWKLRAVLESAPNPILEVDADGTIRYLNQAPSAGDLERVLRTSLYDYVLAADHPAVRAAITAALHSNEPHSVDCAVRQADGRPAWYTYTVGRLERTEGPPRVIIIGTENTERREMEEALRRSESRWRSVVENAPAAIMELALDGTVRFINRSPTGPDRQSMIGRNISEFSTSADANISWNAALARIARTGDPESFETSRPSPNGERIWLHNLVGAVLRDTEIVGYTLITTDISSRKQAEAELLRSREEAETLASIARDLTEALDQKVLLQRIARHVRVITGSDMGIVSIRTPDGDLEIAAQDGARTTLGLGSRHSTMSTGHSGKLKYAAQMLDIPNHPGLTPEARETAAAEGMVTSAVQAVHMDGEMVAVLAVAQRSEREYTPADLALLERLAGLSAAALRNAALYRELETANRGLEEAVAEATRLADAAQESARLKSEFLATMSHEIRTPITGIMSMVELLQATDLSHEQEEYAGVAMRSTELLLVLLNDILDLSKIEAGKLTLEHVAFNPHALIEESVEVMSALSREKHLCVSSYVDADVGRWLRQVLLNMVGNPLKFTHTGEVHVSARVDRTTDTQTWIRFSVQDTGIGLSAVARRRLFQPFTQADGSTTRQYGGTGLGLTICKRLVGLMGGDIRVESVEGVGSKFWFTLPLERMDTAGALNAAPPEPALHGAVVVVEPVPWARAALCRYLTAWGIQALPAADAEAALRQFHTPRASGDPVVAAVIAGDHADLHAAGLAQDVRTDPLLSDLPLLLLTAQPASDQETLRSGFNAALVRPPPAGCAAGRAGHAGQHARPASVPTPGPATPEARAGVAGRRPVPRLAGRGQPGQPPGDRAAIATHGD